MNNNDKTLPDYIKQAVDLYGRDTVKDIRLSNILNDIASFEPFAASKNIIRTLLKDGYGIKVLQTEGSLLALHALSSEIADKYGYLPQSTDYILFSLAYGLGFVEDKPVYENINAETYEYTNTHSEYKITDLNNELAKQKEEYAVLLNRLITVPKYLSGFYSASALSQLQLTENKIFLLQKALNILQDDWCQKEKEAVLKRYSKNTASLKQRVRAASAVAVLLLIIFIVYGSLYISASSDRKTFASHIQKGDALLQKGNYEQAVSHYKNAYTDYNAFRSVSYKRNALDKINNAADMLTNSGSNAALRQSYKLLQSSMQLNLSPAERLSVQDKIKSLQTEIDSRLDKGRNTLALNISANNGKLNKDGEQLLEDLLKLSPEDYWLNFIKKKNNE